MAKITNRFKNLLALVEAETGKRPTYDEIQGETGIALSSLSAYAKGTVSRYDEKTLIALVEFFNKRLQEGCSLDDLLEYPPVKSQEFPRNGDGARTGIPAPMPA